jgi:nucleotide-binding universal stress UspA family protein
VFRNILVAVDGSPTASRALEEAVELAQALNARLTIIAVALEVPSFAYRAGIDVQALEHEAQDETDKLLRDAVAGLPAELPVTTVLKHGHAGERIVEQLQAGDHDLLVMGTRGRGRIVSNLFGSVAAYVHFHARVAMLIVHPDDGVPPAA